MTLTLAAFGRRSIWVMTDRRLTFADGSHRDDATKTVNFEATDGLAVIGYAGLGETAAGMQPSQWITNVLRGYKVPLVDSLNILARAAKESFANRLTDLAWAGNAAHTFLIAAHVKKEPRLYSIDLLSGDNGLIDFRYTQHVNPRGVAHRLAAAGSGAPFLQAHPRHARAILRAIRATEDERIRPETAAEQLAMVNAEVSRNVSSVSPGCIVLWRYMDVGGGAHRTFGPDEGNGLFGDLIPTVAGGMPVHEILQAVGPMLAEHTRGMLDGKQSEIDEEEMQRLLSRVKGEPDDAI
jgi:hypothetical protein